MAASAIEAHGLSKRFLLRHNRAGSLKVRALGLLHRGQRETLEEFWAIRDLSLTIEQGESVGLIGRNGSGKSTLLKLIARIHRPTGGRLLIAKDARIGTMIELGVGFHPDLTGTENVFLNAAINGLSREEITNLYPGIVEYSGLSHFMDVAIKNYSSGMHMRLGFSIAANLNPDILLLDEIFAVGDEDFQRKCIRTMAQFSDEGRTIIFVSHAAAFVRGLCRRACLMDHGRLVFSGTVDAAFDQYRRLQAAGPPSVQGGTPPEHVVEELVEVEFDRASAGDDADWQRALLAREGLRSGHRLLELGLEASGPTPLQRAPVAAQHDYWPVMESVPAESGPWNYVWAPRLFSRLPLNAIGRSMAVAAKHLAPGGRIYATWHETEDHGALRDEPPFEYSMALLSVMFAALGLETHRVTGSRTPDGESVLVILKPGALAGP